MEYLGDGRFRLPRAGRVVVRAPGYAEQTVSFPSPIGGPIRIVLRPASAIYGRLNWPDGAPAADVALRLTTSPLNSVTHVHWPGAGRQLRTDERGEFVIEGLDPAGDVSVDKTRVLRACVPHVLPKTPLKGRLVPGDAVLLDLTLERSDG